MNRQPRGHDTRDHRDAALRQPETPAEIRASSPHPVYRVVLQGHIIRRHFARARISVRCW